MEYVHMFCHFAALCSFFLLPDICIGIGPENPAVFCFIHVAEDPEGFWVVEHKLQPDPMKYWQLVKTMKKI